MEKTFVTPEELQAQKNFAGRILRANAAHTAETGEVRRAWVDCYGCQQNEADAEILRGELREHPPKKNMTHRMNQQLARHTFFLLWESGFIEEMEESKF